jgi:hypothetical protein
MQHQKAKDPGCKSLQTLIDELQSLIVCVFLCHIPDDVSFWAEQPKFRKSPLVPLQVPSTRRSVVGNAKHAPEFLLITASSP